MVAARCTTGPSRPVLPPVESVTIEAKAEASPSRRFTRPSRSAAASITSETLSARLTSAKWRMVNPRRSRRGSG
jgi:hypothetical protein